MVLTTPKHQGRRQLGPFLKGCGMPFEDSMTWWRKEMTIDGAIDMDKFEKTYIAQYNL